MQGRCGATRNPRDPYVCTLRVQMYAAPSVIFTLITDKWSTDRFARVTPNNPA